MLRQRQLHAFFASVMLRGIAVESFQSPLNHHGALSMPPRRTPITITALRAADVMGEAELKAELTEYLKKRDEAGGDAAAKA